MKEIHTCVICGKQFTPKRRKSGLCCSRECAFEYNRQRLKKRDKDVKVCKYCGKEFIEHRLYLPNMYCSHECQVAEKKRLAVIHQEELTRKKQEAERVRLMKKVTQLVKKTLKEKQKEIDRTCECPECGKIFEGTGVQGGKRYCSDACRKRKQNRGHDRRLNRCNIRDNSITLKKLYERDGGVCQICGAKLSFSGDPNSDEYPSIDHIIPISKGGDHVWNNVQLACRRCNTEKSDNLGEFRENKPLPLENH